MKINKIQVFPIKSLDPVVLQEVEITNGGTLKWDRRFGIHRKSDGRTVNGKKYPKIHQLRSTFDLENMIVEFWSEDFPLSKFSLKNDLVKIGVYLSEFFEEEVYLLENENTGFPDHTSGNVGASLISTQTLEKVGQWFNLPVEEVLRRMRMNIVIDAPSAFYEDNLLGVDKLHPKPFKIGAIQLNGYKPCERCPVPTRDSYTGEVIKGFQKEFLQKRLQLDPSIKTNILYKHAYMCGIVLTIDQASYGQVLTLNEIIENE
ncbi:MOSC domain-containing protein [Flammeovirga pectinis]|uniref:MOSC domain-containing protein n=1 Tax=Flammeovirga pectinis TaxID=2494373 RepID=A0A3Q9FKD0_9BACT|nr:MOSC N-terminal beta barrel domain-containing protein [Flammeovirga pectinis]AZQ61692.1 MOSC domain-containing protein [Flammeovirga pectinis]